MECYRCGEEVGNAVVCPHCNADLSLFVKARHISNALYNEGLQKATVRNLSGAIVSLKGSLRFNKYNIEARNLLGLVYYEVGEIVDALSEWVISRSYQPKDNLATKYLEDIQANSSQLEAVNQTIKKYNQALQYCKQDSRDLAIIQLKKVLSLNPKLVKAHQLLALLYLQENKFDLAKKTLREAGKIDTDNTRTLRYLKEVNAKIREQGKKKKDVSDDLISYQSGNEMIIMPKRFRESSLGTTILSVVIGLAIGIAVTCFLVVPNVRSRAKKDAAKQLVTANDTISTNEFTISDLRNQLDTLQSSYDEAVTGSNSVTAKLEATDKLLQAYSQAVSGNTTEAATLMGEINQESLDDQGKEVYNMVRMFTDTEYMLSVYNEGIKYYNAKDYENAAKYLVRVVGVDKNYDGGSNDEGRAIFYLAYSYFYLGEAAAGEGGNAEDAKMYYQKAVDYSNYIVKEFPNTQKASSAEGIIYTSNTHL